MAGGNGEVVFLCDSRAANLVRGVWAVDVAVAAPPGGDAVTVSAGELLLGVAPVLSALGLVTSVSTVTSTSFKKKQFYLEY